MFRVEPTPTKRPLGRGNKWIADHERDTSLETVGALTQESRQFMKLVWRGRVTPFEIVRSQMRDESTGEVYYLTQFTRFPGAVVKKDYGDDVVFHRFASDEERREAQLLAVEALLVYGGIYDGEERPDGYNRVEFEGRLYRKSDFGMAW